MQPTARRCLGLLLLIALAVCPAPAQADLDESGKQQLVGSAAAYMGQNPNHWLVLSHELVQEYPFLQTLLGSLKQVLVDDSTGADAVVHLLQQPKVDLIHHFWVDQSESTAFGRAAKALLESGSTLLVDHPIPVGDESSLVAHFSESALAQVSSGTLSAVSMGAVVLPERRIVINPTAAELREQLREQEKITALLKEQLVMQEKESKTLGDQVQSLLSAKEQLEEKVDESESRGPDPEMERLTRLAQEKEAQILQMMERSENDRQRRQELEREVAVLTRRMREQEGIVEQLKGQIAQPDAAVQATDAKLQALEEEKVQLQARLRETQKELQEASQAAAAAVSVNSSEQVVKLETDLIELRKSLAEGVSRMQILLAQLNESEKLKASFEQQVKDLTQQLENRAQVLGKSQVASTKSEGMLLQLKQQVQAGQRSEQVLQEKLAQAHADLTSQAQALQEAQSRIEQLQRASGDKASLMGDLDRAVKANQELTQRLAEAQKVQESLDAKYRQEAQAKDENLRTVDKAARSVEESLRERERDIQVLREELAQSQEARRSLEGRVAALIEEKGTSVRSVQQAALGKDQELMAKNQEIETLRVEMEGYKRARADLERQLSEAVQVKGQDLVDTRRALAAKESELRKFQAQSQELQSELAAVGVQAEDLKKIKSTLEQKLEQSKAEQQRYQRAHDDFEDRVAKLIRAKDEELRSMQLELQRLQGTAEEGRKTREEITVKTTQLKKEKEEASRLADQELAKKEDEVQVLKKELEAVKKELGGSRKAREEIEGRFVKLQEEKEATVSALEKSLKTKQEEGLGLEVELGRVRAELADLRKSKEGTEIKLVSAQQEVARLQDALQAEQAQNKSASEQVKSRDEVIRSRDEQIRSLQTQIEGIQQEAQFRSRAIDLSEQQLTQLRAERSKLAEEVTHLRSLNSELGHARDRQEVRLEAAQTHATDLEDRLRHLQEVQNTTLAESKELTRSLAEVRQANGDLQANVVRLEQRNLSLTSENDQLQKSFAAEQDETEKLTSALADARQLTDRLRNAEQQAQQTGADMEDQLKMAQQVQSEQMNEIRNLRAELGRQREQIAALELERDRLKALSDGQQEQLSRLESERTALRRESADAQIISQRAKQETLDRDSRLQEQIQSYKLQVERLQQDLELAQNRLVDEGRVKDGRQADHEAIVSKLAAQLRDREEELARLRALLVRGDVESPAPAAAPTSSSSIRETVSYTPAPISSTDGVPVKVYRTNENLGFLVLSLGKLNQPAGSTILLKVGDQAVMEVELGDIDSTGLSVAYIRKRMRPDMKIQAGDLLVAQPTAGPSASLKVAGDS